MHVLPPVAAINGARSRELTGDDQIPENAQISLPAFRAVVGNRTFQVGFCLGNATGFSAIGIAVIDRLMMEAPGAALHVVPVAHLDIAWDIVLRHLRSFRGQVLLFAFPDSNVYDAGTAEIYYSKAVQLFDATSRQLERVTAGQRQQGVKVRAHVSIASVRLQTRGDLLNLQPGLMRAIEACRHMSNQLELDHLATGQLRMRHDSKFFEAENQRASRRRAAQWHVEAARHWASLIKIRTQHSALNPVMETFGHSRTGLCRYFRLRGTLEKLRRKLEDDRSDEMTTGPRRPAHRSTGWAVFAVTAAFLGVCPALAQGTAQERSDCLGDAFRFCSSDIPFVSEIESCLEENIPRLSPACRREFLPSRQTKLQPEHF